MDYIEIKGYKSIKRTKKLILKTLIYSLDQMVAGKVISFLSLNF